MDALFTHTRQKSKCCFCSLPRRTSREDRSSLLDYAGARKEVQLEWMMFRNKGFIFTNKEYSKTGIMSTVFGVLACTTLGTAVYLSYLNGGESSARYGAAAFLAVLFGAAGVILGILSTAEKEKFKLFTVLGIFVNILAFGMLSLILFAGAYID